MVACGHNRIRPLQEHFTDGRLVLRREVWVYPIHRQTICLSLPPGTLHDWKGGIPVWLAFGKAFGGLVDDAHEKGASAPGVILSVSLVVADQRCEGEQLGEHLIG